MKSERFMDIQSLTINSFHTGLLKKKFSAREVAEAFFSAIAKRDGELNSYLRLRKEQALAEAYAVDAVVKSGGALHLLAGVPMAIKDTILIKGEITSAASKILSKHKAAYDATAIARLRKAGAVFLGHTNCDEFAMGSSTENSAYGPTKNPHDPERVPGGSSGGSAAAVAAGLSLAALGSDTGGSVRQPAAFCGIVGLKPSYGSVSRFGLIAMASSLDVIGPMTKTVEDAALIFQTMAGRDDFDATSADKDWSGVLDEGGKSVSQLKIGLPKEYFSGGFDPAVQRQVDEAIDKFKKTGFAVREVSLPHTQYALSVYYIVMPAEVSTNLARYDGIRYSRIAEIEDGDALADIYLKNRGMGFGKETRRRALLGAFVLSAGYYDAYYSKAQKVRRLVRNDFEKAFDEVDLLLTPVAPTPAFKIGEKTDDPVQMYLSDVFTIPASLAGLPAISIPVKKYILGSGELPVGFQLIGRRFRERDILRAGMAYEKHGGEK